MLNEKELDFWIKNNFNVLFEGRHGVGKTAIITQAFERNNLNWRYFSAATMDPWVDFVGVPDKIVDGDEKYIELVRPRGFHNGEVEAIFMDELNRAPKKVRNAVMELIQFKSINGVKFPNLRFIWAAINPESSEDDAFDTSYDVESLDEAQKDRFEIHIDIPYAPDKKYFHRTFGESGSGAVEWWKNLPSEQKDYVSPRRLEYAIRVWQAKGNVRHVIKEKSINVSQLISVLNSGPIEDRLKKLRNASDEEIRNAFSDINFTTDAFPFIIKNKSQVKRFANFLPKEHISKTIVGNNINDARNLIENIDDTTAESIIKSIIDSGTLNKRKIKMLSNKLGKQFSRHVSLPPPLISSDIDSFSDILKNYYREVNGGNKIYTSQQRTKAVEYVSDIIEYKMSDTDKDEFILVLLFVSAIIHRTQQLTLSRETAIKQGLNNIIKEWVSKGKTKNYYLNDFWKNIVRPELERKPSERKIIYSGQWRYSKAVLDKIEYFLNNGKC